MIGKAVPTSIPSALTNARQGAYRPTPIIIRAPKKKLTTTPITNLIPVKPNAVPAIPKGPTPAFLQAITIARIIRPTPRPIRTYLTFHLQTIPAPTRAPTTAPASINTKVRASISTKLKNSNASNDTGNVSPTFSVPGIVSSGLDFVNLNPACVVA